MSALFDVAAGFSQNDRRRLALLRELAQCKASEGDFIELGVFRGGSALVLAAALERQPAARRLHLCDWWRGVPRHAAQDSGCVAAAGTFADCAEWTAAELFRENGLAHRCEWHAGDVAETLPKLAGPFALAHVDLDLYVGTRLALEHLIPRMTAGGVIVVDDYGAAGPRRNFPGVEHAVTEVLDRLGGWRVVATVGERDQAAVLMREL